MLLSSSQSPDFDITKDLVDLSKSSNLLMMNEFDNIFQEAYKWLFDKLGYDKWIWCYKDGDRNYLNHGDEHVLWTLDVPESECVFINGSVWEHVINRWAYDKTMDEDKSLVISDEDYDKFVELHKGKESETWGDIFNPNEESGIQVLIKSLVLEKYVIKKEWICDYDINTFKEEDDLISYHFSDMDRLKHIQDVYESGLRGRKMSFNTKIDTYDKGFGLKIEWGDINKE